MRVFVTGASGFVGSAIVKELLHSGHQVLGLVRTDSAAEGLIKIGAEACRGDLDDLESIKKGAAQCDAVIHTAFNHDFSRFKANCENDRQVILALGAALAGSGRPLVVTSGIGLLNNTGQQNSVGQQNNESQQNSDRQLTYGNLVTTDKTVDQDNLSNPDKTVDPDGLPTPGRLVTETDVPPGSDIIPRAASEEAAKAVAGQGINTYIVRLPPTVHGQDDHGFIPIVIGMAKEKGESAYIGEGNNRWPAVHRLDAAVLYRLIVEKQPQQKVYHAVAEEGIPFRQIATAIGQGLHLSTVSKDGEDAGAHFGWFRHFASINCPASSEQTRRSLGWEPRHPGLLDDLTAGVYFS